MSIRFSLDVKVEPPIRGCHYWKVLAFKMIIALCPSMETAIDVGKALQFYIDHHPENVLDNIKREGK